MNYIKSFWTSDPPTSSENSQQQQPYNSVTFTTQTSGNSFVITTTSQVPQRPQQLVFHKNSTPLKPEMAVSPSDSFHSTSSNFDQPIKEKKSKGNVNNGYTGSTSELSTETHHHHHHHHHVHSNNSMVHREQYWSWQWPFTPFWDEWNNREKIFLIVIVALSLTILILISILSVTLVRNFQMRQIILERLNESFSIM